MFFAFPIFSFFSYFLKLFWNFFVGDLLDQNLLFNEKLSGHFTARVCVFPDPFTEHHQLMLLLIKFSIGLYGFHLLKMAKTPLKVFLGVIFFSFFFIEFIGLLITIFNNLFPWTYSDTLFSSGKDVFNASNYFNLPLKGLSIVLSSIFLIMIIKIFIPIKDTITFKRSVIALLSFLMGWIFLFLMIGIIYEFLYH